MNSSKKAQSLFEFLVLFTLAAAAVVIMSPSVRNSLYGYFKSLEESVYDSETEVQKKAPPGQGGIGRCVCGVWSAGNCGGPPPQEPRCPIGTRLWTFPCSGGLNCRSQTPCRIDPTCCSP